MISSKGMAKFIYPTTTDFWNRKRIKNDTEKYLKNLGCSVYVKQIIF